MTILSRTFLAAFYNGLDKKIEPGKHTECVYGNNWLHYKFFTVIIKMSVTKYIA